MELSESYPIIKALILANLKSRMQKGEVMRFVYQKKDGSLRQAVGTLQSDAVKANIVGTGHNIGKEQFAYIDLERMQWRSFLKENLIGIID